MHRVVTEMSQTARGAVSRTHQASRVLAVDGGSGGSLNELEVVTVVNHGERERGKEGRQACEDHDGSSKAQRVEDAFQQFDRFRHALRGVGDDAHLPIEPERRARNTPKMWQTASSCQAWAGSTSRSRSPLTPLPSRPTGMRRSTAAIPGRPPRTWTASRLGSWPVPPLRSAPPSPSSLPTPSRSSGSPPTPRSSCATLR